MDAGEVFGLTKEGRVTTADGRKWVVYCDGCYRHAVAADHWDECGQEPTDDKQERRDRFDAWHNDQHQWADDLTAREAAHHAGLFVVHSKDGCGAMECDTHGLCRAICDANWGESIDSEEFKADAERVDWDGVWPVIDGDCELTGRISEGGDGWLSYDDEAMIDVGVAQRAGWRIDYDERTAEPAAPVVVEFAVADETIRENGGLRDFSQRDDRPSMTEACAAYRSAATSALADNSRAGRLSAAAPQGQRRLASGWCGAHWGYSAGAIGAMADDLTRWEKEAIDAAHEAGVAAARKVIEEADAAWAAQWRPTHRITLDGGKVIDVMLDEGRAYTAAEWATESSADCECDDDGRWTFLGQPLNGTVETIN